MPPRPVVATHPAMPPLSVAPPPFLHRSDNHPRLLLLRPIPCHVAAARTAGRDNCASAVLGRGDVVHRASPRAVQAVQAVSAVAEVPEVTAGGELVRAVRAHGEVLAVAHRAVVVHAEVARGALHPAGGSAVEVAAGGGVLVAAVCSTRHTRTTGQ